MAPAPGHIGGIGRERCERPLLTYLADFDTAFNEKGRTTDSRSPTCRPYFEFDRTPSASYNSNTYPAGSPTRSFCARPRTIDAAMVSRPSVACHAAGARAGRRSRRPRRSSSSRRRSGRSWPRTATRATARRSRARVCGSTHAAGLKAGADDGPVVVPGDPAKSRLIQSVKRARATSRCRRRSRFRPRRSPR